MRTTLVLHVIAGSLALVSGFVALYAAKGARLHRKAGMVFVCLMLTMSFSGMLIAAVRGVAPALNIPVVLLTAYLVITSLTTVRPLPAGSRWLGLGAMLIALAVGTIDLKFGFDALASPDGKTDGIPPVPFFVFGAVALLGSAGRSPGPAIGPSSRRTPSCKAPVAHVVRALHRGVVVLHRAGAGNSKAGAHLSPACGSSAGGARDHVLLAVARPHQAVLSRHCSAYRQP